MQIPLSQDRSLLDGLIRHLSPAMERILKGETIRNPLLSQIKRDYESLFNVVHKCADDAWEKLLIPDEEVGYLVMHFGAAIERWKLTPGNLRVLLVCMSGIGSSKLLAVRLTKEIPQINLLGHYSWYEASRMPRNEYDLIVSTVDLPIEAERYIKLSPLLTREESEKLRAHVRGLVLSINAAIPIIPIKDDGALERLKLMNGYSSELIGILYRFQVYYRQQTGSEGDLRGLLRCLLDLLTPVLLENKALIVDQLIERETQGSVSAPVISLYCLESPIYLGEDHSEVKLVFLMLAPVSLNKHALEDLSEISGLLLQPTFVERLEDRSEEKIKSFISRNIEAFIKNKLEWREPS